jgi:hypothetical protein
MYVRACVRVPVVGVDDDCTQCVRVDAQLFLLFVVVLQIRCLTLFVTHYPLLANLSVLFPRVVENYHMAFMTVRANLGFA